MMCLPRAEFVPRCGQKLGALDGSWAVGSFRGGAAVASKNVEMAFSVPLLCWRFSERVGFGERDRERCGALVVMHR